MQIIVDSNILFAALIRDSTTRRLILDFQGTFLFPEVIFEEILEHIQEIIEKSELSELELQSLIHKLSNRFYFVPNSILLRYKSQAEELCKDIDLDDIHFFACALLYPNSIIWSDDIRLKYQNKIRIISTKEMIELFFVN